MLKLVRLALTGAVLTAIAVRLRRRARLPKSGPPVPPAGPAVRSSVRRRGALGRWPAILAGVVLLAVAAQLVTTLALADPDDSPSATPALRASAPADPRLSSGTPAPADTSVPSGTPASAGTPASTGTPDSPTPPDAVPGAACRAAAGAVVVRPPDPAVKRAVDRQWKRIERWLRAKAPATYRTLGRPGRAGTIAVAESQMGVRFPDSLRASLLRHDSTRSGFPGGRPLSVRGIRDTWRELCSSAPDGAVPGDEASPERWDGSLIPLAHDGEGGLLVADPRTGVVTGPGGLRFTSYYALLRATADALESGAAVGPWQPEVTGGRLRWRNG